MAKAELLTLSSLLGLFSPQGVYLLAYAWLFGMCKCNKLMIGPFVQMTLESRY